MKKILLFTVFLFASLLLEAQNMIQSYVINIENGKVCLDITAPKVKVGDVLSIHEDAGYMVHPVTKRKIKKEGAILADLEIVEVYGEYSVATIYPEEAVKKIKEGMIAEMPELPQGYTGSLANNVEDEEPQVVVPTDADGIVGRYLRAIGLDEKKISNYLPPCYVKGSSSCVTTKGQIYTTRNFYACDWIAKKMHTAHIASKKMYNYVLVLNGNEGWWGFAQGIVGKCKASAVAESWKVFDDKTIFDLAVFNAEKWQRVLGGKRIVKGKQCTGVVFMAIGQTRNKETFYFDDVTGLPVLAEGDGFETNFLEYRTFGDLVLCSKQQAVYFGELAKKSKLKEVTITLQEVCLDCSLDNSLFTKEGAKRAFK
mgnify:CR=1 FL=1